MLFSTLKLFVVVDFFFLYIKYWTLLLLTRFTLFLVQQPTRGDKGGWRMADAQNVLLVQCKLEIEVEFYQTTILAVVCI